MKAPGAAPAVRPREDRVISVSFAHARQFGCDQVERIVPADFDKGITASFAFAPFQPALSNGGAQNAGLAVQRSGHVGVQLRRGGVKRVVFDIYQPPVFRFTDAKAPVVGGQIAVLVFHRAASDEQMIGLSCLDVRPRKTLTNFDGVTIGAIMARFIAFAKG